MALEDIKNKIISDAQTKAKEIKTQNQKKISDIKNNSSKDIQNIKSKILETARNKAKEKLKSALIDQKIKNSNDILKVKRQIINVILKNTISDLEKISDSEYKKLILIQLKKIETIKFDSLTVLCAKGKVNLVKEIFSNNFKTSQIDFEETGNIQGGFKIKTNNSIIDLSFANLIEENRYLLESEINKLVFTK